VKRNDIGPSAQAYAAAHLLEPAGQSAADGERISLAGDARLAADQTMPESERQDALAEPDRSRADAITVNPYLGLDGVAPFIATATELGKGLFVLVRTSNKSAGQVQDFADESGKKLYEQVADLVETWANNLPLIGRCGYSLVGAVVGATCSPGGRTSPADAAQHRAGAGLRAQGATADDCMASFKPDGSGAIVNASRSVLYAFDREPYRSRFGKDWRSAIAAAAKDFRDDLARAIAERKKPAG